MFFKESFKSNIKIKNLKCGFKYLKTKLLEKKNAKPNS